MFPAFVVGSCQVVGTLRAVPIADNDDDEWVITSVFSSFFFLPFFHSRF